MDTPTPRPGLVIRYAYLWKQQADRGAEDGNKDRPCAILLATTMRDDDTVVLVLPVTHTPQRDADAIEIPTPAKQRLGLDDARSWIVLTELNQFIWPGPDLRPAPGTDTVAYGDLPAHLYRRVRQRWLQLYDRGAVRSVKRSD